MTRQQKFEALVAHCVRMNDPQNNPGPDGMKRYENALHDLGQYVWQNEHRVTIASGPNPKERK